MSVMAVERTSRTSCASSQVVRSQASACSPNLAVTDMFVQNLLTAGAADLSGRRRGRGRGHIWRGQSAGSLIGALRGGVGVVRVGSPILKRSTGGYHRKRMLLRHIVPGILQPAAGASVLKPQSHRQLHSRRMRGL